MGKIKAKTKKGTNGPLAVHKPTTEYKIGSMSALIAQSCGVDKLEFDPKLVSLFSNAGSTQTVKIVKNSGSFQPPSAKELKINRSLSNKDAADIRVGAKAKFQIQQDEPIRQPKLRKTLPQKPEKPLPPKLPKQTLSPPKVKVPQAAKNSDDTSPEIKSIEIDNITDAPKVKGKSKKHKKNKVKATELPDLELTLKPEVQHEDVDVGISAKSKKHKNKIKAIELHELKPEDVDVDMDMPTATEDIVSTALPLTNSTPTSKPVPNKKAEVGEVKKTLRQQNAPKEKNPELEARTIFVGNVPKDGNKKMLMKLFKEFGKIETIRLRCAAVDKPTQLKKVAMNKKELHPDRNSVAAYIRFESRQEAEKACAQTLTLLGHHLILDLADSSVKKDNKKGIFVGNLHHKTKDDELWELFSDCGEVESVRVVRDRDTGLGKGFGYVNFKDRAHVELALKMEGTEFKNRDLRVSRCVKKVKSVKTEGNFNGTRSVGPPGRGGGVRKLSQGQRQRQETFGGDRTAEVGKFKRNSKKPNKEEMKKARIAKQLSVPIAVAPVPVSGGYGPKVPVSVKEYKANKKELRKLNRPRWPRENKAKKNNKTQPGAFKRNKADKKKGKAS